MKMIIKNWTGRTVKMTLDDNTSEKIVGFTEENDSFPLADNQNTVGTKENN